jgi:predicted PurR-regulated permease PerM
MWRWTVGAIVLWWVGVLAANTVRQLQEIFVIAIVSFLVACALEQPVTRLESRGMRRGFATLLVLLLLSFFAAAVSIGGGTLIVTQISSLAEALPGLATSVKNLAGLVGVNIPTELALQNLGERISAALAANAGNLLLQGTLLVGQFAAGLLLTFYLVADGPRLRRNVCSLFPQHRQQTILEVWTAAIQKAGGYLVVRAVLAVAAAVATWVFLTVAGVDYAIALGLWVGVISQIVPAVGTYLAAALPLLVAADESAGVFVATALFLILYQQFENYLLAPRIARRVMQVHPAIGFFAAISGAVVAGAPGALIAVPIVATAQAVISASLDRHQLVENELLDEVKPRPGRLSKPAVAGKGKPARARVGGAEEKTSVDTGKTTGKLVARGQRGAQNSSKNSTKDHSTEAGRRVRRKARRDNTPK